VRWEGQSAHLLANRFGDVRDRTVVKVGMSTDPARRCVGLNSSLPPASVARWVIAAESEFFVSIDAAKRSRTASRRSLPSAIPAWAASSF
jgi:hypothetical protein